MKNMKKLVLVILGIVILIGISAQVDKALLSDDESYLRYVGKDVEGYYFIDIITDETVFIGLEDYKIDLGYKVDESKIYQNKMFIGKFYDEDKIDLEYIKEI